MEEDINQSTNSDLSRPAAKKISPDIIDPLDVHESAIVCTQAYYPSKDLPKRILWYVGNDGQLVGEKN